jgi:hypothetical protein
VTRVPGRIVQPRAFKFRLRPRVLPEATVPRVWHGCASRQPVEPLNGRRVTAADHELLPGQALPCRNETFPYRDLPVLACFAIAEGQLQRLQIDVVSDQGQGLTAGHHATATRRRPGPSWSATGRVQHPSHRACRYPVE